MGEIFSRLSIRYSLSILVTVKRSSNFLLYKRSEQHSDQRGFEWQEAYKFSVPLFGKNVVYDCSLESA